MDQFKQKYMFNNISNNPKKRNYKHRRYSRKFKFFNFNL